MAESSKPKPKPASKSDAEPTTSETVTTSSASAVVRTTVAPDIPKTVKSKGYLTVCSVCGHRHEGTEHGSS